ncbi:Gfo/Idh/MocA family oxidoreductase [Chitinophaga sp. CC14]|uniref:Gfo/Idh/MocA family oxidoreductase n=1 Tax=Chitinophaga TaxID=79328 RepID=UPI000DB9C4FA|nr:Gfo/Idh/MocA family oxidoreductase [Chitinophaga ginsengisegetis]MDR6567910.1 putative dehydrogenase [Chitinophaga ginsengisegetis]MDR6647535.1 putative dehydrogenase [Chitinophaga ginsengisegetis]MDR6653885.1 putative dehydrogenase [Chitinophaga ginsengisegetis]
MENFNINRRRFLKGATATLALSAIGASALDFINPAKPLRVALIGTGWYGKSDLFRLIQVAPVKVVALCDVDKNMLQAAAEMVRKRQSSGETPRLYADYRKLLSENELDIVLIGTPDHWHALQTIEALKAGANVYVQKPISVDVIEGEAMVAAARKYNRVVQVGTQRKSTPHLIDAKKNIVDAGLLGKISHVEMCCYYHMRNNGNPPVQAVPDYFDYDMWTGPAPLRPYDGLPHVRWWRTFMEYGNGIMGDMCVHMFDTVRWMLQLGWPKRISSTGGIYVQKEGKSNIADTQSAIFEYDGLNCVWQHRTWGTAADPKYPWSFKLYGEKGTLAASTMSYDFIPEGNGTPIHKDVVFEKEKYPEDLTEPAIELNAAPATRLHMLDFLGAIKNGSKPVADIEEGHISTASCILANISMQTGRPVIYDPQKRIITGDPAATALLQRPYRSPWIHPVV